MSSESPTRDELVGAFLQEISRFSTWTVIYHNAVAVSLGLNPTDLKFAAVLQESGPLTAGELADLLGLTTGAVTGVIDRLEKLGLAARVKDPHDRRRVIVEVREDPALMQRLNQVFASLAEASTTELLNYYDEAQLTVILDFVRRGHRLMKDQAQKLHEKMRTGSDAD